MSEAIAAELLRRFEGRGARAESLAEAGGSAAVPLAFSAAVWRAQGVAAAAVAVEGGRATLAGHPREDALRVMPALRAVLAALAKGPEALAAEVRVLQEASDEDLVGELVSAWEGDPGDDWVVRALLRPYGEALRSLEVDAVRARHDGHCPRCGGAPWVAARRPIPSAEGAQRVLSCSLCGLEWEFSRIACPACGEREPGKLPSFSDPRFPAFRVEACETCRHYLKSVDLTLDGRPLPEVDDLLALPLDLWAIEQGFQRLEPGLAGI